MVYRKLHHERYEIYARLQRKSGLGLLSLEAPKWRHSPAITGKPTWKCSHDIFHFRLGAWATAALTWAMGEQAWAEGENSWARPEHMLSKAECILESHFSIRRGLFWLPCGSVTLSLLLCIGSCFGSPFDRNFFGADFGSVLAYVQYTWQRLLEWQGLP
jgi:hypothetical protein